jgi:hypothetical protein
MARRRYLVIMVCAAIAVVTSTAGPGTGLAADLACDPKGCISISTLAKSIASALHNTTAAPRPCP